MRIIKNAEYSKQDLLSLVQEDLKQKSNISCRVVDWKVETAPVGSGIVFKFDLEDVLENVQEQATS